MLLGSDQKTKGSNPTMVIIFLNTFIITYVIKYICTIKVSFRVGNRFPRVFPSFRPIYRSKSLVFFYPGPRLTGYRHCRRKQFYIPTLVYTMQMRMYLY